MITYYYRSELELKSKITNRYKDGTWIHIETPEKEELEKISKKFNLDMSYLEDALDPYEVPRLEKEDGIIYAYVRTPYSENGNITSVPVLFIVSKKYLITICPKKVAIFDKFISSKLEFTTTKCLNLFLQIFWEITNTYNTSLISINRSISQASENIEKIENKDIVKFVNYEHISNNYLSRLIQNNSVVNKIISDKTIKLNETDQELVDDLVVEIGQLIEMSKNCLQSVKNIRDAYSTILSNNLNRVIKLLTSLTIIFNIPTMIAGLWGMNVGLPFSSSPWAFMFVIGIISIICTSLVMLFIKKDYL